MFAFLLAGVAFVHANVVPLDVERVLEDQTLLVTDGKVQALGPTGQVHVPGDATVVDASGKYLLPGLVAVRVSNAQVDAASLERAGVTTLVDVTASPEFVFVSAEDDEKHAYRAKSEAAQRAGRTLLGLAPLERGFAEVVKAKQSLLEVQSLVDLTLFARPPLGRWRVMVLGSVALFALALLVEGAAAVAARRRRERSARMVLPLAFAITLSVGMGTIYVRTFLLGWGWVPTCLVGMGALVMLCGGWLLVAAVGGSWSSRPRRLLVGLAALGGFVFPTSLIRFLPPVERATPFGMEEVIQRCVEAPLYVFSSFAAAHVDLGGGAGNPYFAMERALLQKLGAAGLLVAAPDGRVLDGPSFHAQLSLLEREGLSSFEVLRAATSTPALFLKRSPELGTLEVGRRANVVMTAANPLAGVGTCAHPLGVMTDGHWRP